MGITGGCQCGAVRYRIEGPLGPSGICHCRMCQKAVGGPFAVLVTVERERLRWTHGEPAYFQSSSIGKRGFCRSCGTPLTYTGLRPEEVELTVGSLDQPGAAPPDRQHGIENRLAWVEHMASLPAHPTDAKFAGLVNNQHPDHD